MLLEQATSYPEQGDIEIMIDPRKSFEFTVSLRIPAWSAVSMVTVNGQSVDGATPRRIPPPQAEMGSPATESG